MIWEKESHQSNQLSEDQLDPLSFVQHPSPVPLPCIPEDMHTDSDAVLMASD